MYEEMTYERILQRMLDRVPDLDKREGSVIYTALAPAAVELQNMYIELDKILNETFADTASRENLIKRAAERGVTPRPATAAVWKGEFNVEIPINSRFSLNNLNYRAKEQIIPGAYRMECETPGAIGNGSPGALIPVDYIAGLETARLTELLIPGEDEEETEAFRRRYMESYDSNPCAGNTAYYKAFCGSQNGVGGVKVYPVWNGGGTVKLVFVDSEYQKPSEDLVNSVQTAVDPVQNRGSGMGGAPIGHTVTVEGVNETTVHVGLTITYASGWKWEDLKGYVEKVVDDYFLELSKAWENEAFLIARISRLESRLLDLEGIMDVSHTVLNGAEENLVLGADSIPVRGGISG